MQGLAHGPGHRQACATVCFDAASIRLAKRRQETRPLPHSAMPMSGADARSQLSIGFKSGSPLAIARR